MPERKKLFETHKELMRIKKNDIDRALNFFNQAQRVYQNTIQIIMSELGIPKKDIKKWKLSNNGKCFEKMIEPKKVKMTTVKNREKKKP